MIKPDMIPDEVVGAAARAICEAEYGACDGCGPSECSCTYWQGHARASIAAAINAWPDAGLSQFHEHAIILPLPQETRDE